MLSDLGRNLFYAFIAELLVAVIALLVREDKKKVIVVLLVGTIIAGSIGFGTPFAETFVSSVTATVTIEDIASNDQPVELASDSQLSNSDFGSLLYEDTFETDAGVWSLQSGNSIQNGELILSPATSTFPNWSTEYSDFIFETEFRFVNPQSTHYFTAYLRYTDCAAGNCSTQVFVSSSSDIAAWHIGPDKKQLMNYTQASQLKLNEPNTLTVVAKGSEFNVYVNRVFVRSFSDASYKSGKVVLDADEAPTAVGYVRIYALP